MKTIPIERINIGRIWRAGRLLSGKTQKELAQALSIPQSSISKYENLNLEPSASDWYRFCEYVGIDAHRTLNQGYIDGRQKFRDKLYSTSLFKLPIRYRKDSSLKIRELLPFRTGFIKILGQNEWDNFIQTIGVDDELFYILDHQVSLTMLLDLLAWCESRGVSLMENVVAEAAAFNSHGILGIEFSRKKNPSDLLRSLLENQELYQKVLHVNCTQSNILTEGTLNVQHWLADFFEDSVLNLFVSYKGQVLAELIRFHFPEATDPILEWNKESLRIRVMKA